MEATDKKLIAEAMDKFNAGLFASDLNAISTMLDAVMDCIDVYWIKQSINTIKNYADGRSEDWKKYENGER